MYKEFLNNLKKIVIGLFITIVGILMLVDIATLNFKIIKGDEDILEKVRQLICE